MGEEEKKELAAEEKDGEAPPEIVLKVYMHCEGCAKKVERSLRGFEGVDEVKADSRSHTVVVKGKAADPTKICERVQRKTGRKTELVSPLPKPPEEEAKKEEPKEEEKKEEPPTAITVVLNVRMHCEACAEVLQRKIKKIDGVESVVTDFPNNQVIVQGIIDPEKLVENVKRRTRKRASIVKDEEKKEEAAEGEKKEEVKEGEDKKTDVNKHEYWAPRYSIQYAYPPQIFSDENPNACSVM